SAVAPNQPVTLTLVSENGLTAVVDPGQVAIPLNGSVTVTPEGTMSVTYQVTVTGACEPTSMEHVIVPIGNPDITLVAPDITSSVVRTQTFGRVTFIIRNKGFTPTFAPVVLKVSLDPAAMVRYQSILQSFTDPGWTVVQAIPGGSLVFTLQTDQPIPGMGKTTVAVLLGFPEGQSSMGTFTNNMANVSTERDSNLSNNTALFSVTTTP